jgi:transcriptional regulator with XRE-family HTH domain
MTTLWVRLEEALAKRGWKPADLARNAQLRPNTLTNWKSGATKNPRKNDIESVARALQIRVEWLKTGTGAMEAGPLDNLTEEDFRGAKEPAVAYAAVGGGKTETMSAILAASVLDRELLRQVLEVVLETGQGQPSARLAEVAAEAYGIIKRTSKKQMLHEMVRMLLS